MRASLATTAALLLSALTCCNSVSLLDLRSRERDPKVKIDGTKAEEQNKLAKSVDGDDAKSTQEAYEDANPDASKAKIIRGDSKTAEKRTADDAIDKEPRKGSGKAQDVSDSKDEKSHASEGKNKEAKDSSDDKGKSKEVGHASDNKGKESHDSHKKVHDAPHPSVKQEKESHDSHKKAHDAKHAADESHAPHKKAEDAHHAASSKKENSHASHDKAEDSHGGHRADSHHGDHAGKEHGTGGHASSKHGEHSQGHQEHGEHGQGGSHGQHAHEDHGHGGHGDHEASGHHGHGHSKGANAVAVGLIATVVLVPLVMWMALEDGLVSNLTFKMLDTFISIFLAVLWYNCFAQALVTFDVANMFPYAAEMFGLVQVLTLYGVSMVVAYQWRDDKKKLITFCCCAAHCIAFSGISFSANTQAHTSEDFAHGDMEPVVSLLFCGLVIAMILFLSMANHMAWRKKVDHGKLDHCVEELELDIIGLVGSFLITQSVRQALVGHYPAVGHFFLQLQDTHGPAHKSWQRMFMLGWAIGLTILSVVAVPRLDKLHGGWALHQFVHISKVLLIMLVAWGYLLWGQWEFFELFFHGDPMFGNMVFAVTTTLVAMGVLYGMAKIFGEGVSREQRETNNMIITGIGLVAAWSWEHCFNLAFDVIGQEYQVGYKGLMPKLFLSIVIPAALLPTYVRHIKSRVIEDEEREHAEEHGHAHGHAEEHGHAHGESHGAAADAEKAN